MSDNDDASYFRRRAEQERHQAAKCTDPAAGLAHLAMATEYEQRAEVVRPTLSLHTAR